MLNGAKYFKCMRESILENCVLYQTSDTEERAGSILGSGISRQTSFNTAPLSTHNSFTDSTPAEGRLPRDDSDQDVAAFRQEVECKQMISPLLLYYGGSQSLTIK